MGRNEIYKLKNLLLYKCASEIPALITEDIETPDIVDITEPITASINGTTLTIDGGNKVSGESTITLTGDVTVNTITKSNLREPSIHKIGVKTNGKGNFTYTQIQA